LIKANHNIIAEVIYKAYISRLLRWNFKKFNLLNEIPHIDKSMGLIITPNHFSWWDGFFADHLMRRFTGRKPYLMMLERQLRKYRFFKYAGAFSIDPERPGSVKESMEYAKKICTSPDDYLIFYPQGEIQLYENKFIKLKRGITLLTSAQNANVLIVSFKIVYNEEKRPSVYCRFGDLIHSHRVSTDFEHYESAFRDNIEKLDSEIYQNKAKDLFRE